MAIHMIAAIPVAGGPNVSTISIVVGALLPSPETV
jgi:hypothetical protein